MQLKYERISSVTSMVKKWRLMSKFLMSNRFEGTIQQKFQIVNHKKIVFLIAPAGRRTWDPFSFHLFSLSSSALDHCAP